MGGRGRAFGGGPLVGPPRPAVTQRNLDQPIPALHGDELLRGIVGSTAYGLDREGSDLDYLGVFAAPTLTVAGLNWHPRHESRVRHEPADCTEHEIGKYLRLALACNPTILELLYLPDVGYDHETDLGRQLRAIRHAFPHEQQVRASYGGYAKQQAHRLRERGDGSFSSDTRRRQVKHARHLLRLLRQGRQLLETGDLIVYVGDPTDYFAFDRMTPDQMLDVYAREVDLFDNCASVLPEVPDREGVAEFLREVRMAHLPS